jgi:6-phosphogluconolactonase (cycloisomerase 2 family)
LTKTVGTQPYFLVQFQAANGTRWLASAEYGSNRVSLFQIAGTDGNIQSQATITANTLLTKTVGTQPISIFQFQATDGTRWLCTTDFGSNRVSLFQIAGTDGNVQDQTTITANTVLTKTVGTQPRSIIQFQATDGTRWIATADYGSNRVSLFQIAGTDGNVQDQATITANTVLTKATGSQPSSVTHFQSTDGTRRIAVSEFGAAQARIFQIAGTDGNIQNQATITANTALTKAVGTNSFFITHFAATNGTQWIATADYGVDQVSMFQIAGTDGNIQSQATITANTRLTKNLGVNPASVFQFQATDGTRWITAADAGSNRVSLFKISATNEAQLVTNYLTNVAITIPNALITATNVAEVTSAVDYFNFAAGMSPAPFAWTFSYSFDQDTSGTVGNGSALRFTTATADISGSSGITVASGAKVRLGKKATYTIPFNFQNGSTLEVFPNSDRSGVDLDLRNCTFAATTTVIATSGTATVLVPDGSSVNISAGAGVTIPVPTVDITLTGLVAGSEVRAYVGTPESYTVLDGTESSSTSFTFSQSVGGQAGFIVVRKLGYKFIKILITYPSTDTTIPVQQQEDPWYNNP